MKILKRFIWLIIVGMLTACQSQDFDLATPAVTGNETSKQISQITEDVNSEEIQNILSYLFGQNAKSRSNSYHLTILNDSVGKPAVLVINYENDGGFALISATKDHSPVLAYNDHGHFELSDDAPAVAKIWLENSIKDVAKAADLPLDSLAANHLLWRKYESVDFAKKHLSRAMGHDRLYDISQAEYEALKKIFQPKMTELRNKGYRVYMIDDYPGTTSFGDDLESFMEGRIYPMYSNDYWAISFVAEKDYTRVISSNGNVLSTQWGQTNGYNQSYPILANGNRAYAGCFAVAIGQLMYFYKYPTSFEWNKMTSTGYGNATTSNLLYNIAQRCKAEYKVDGTSIKTSNAIDALKSYGYDAKKEDFYRLGLSSVTPLIVTSHLNNDRNKGHAWIVEGSINKEYYTELEIWSFTYEDTLEMVYSESTTPSTIINYYVNWGWGGYSDGYYGNLTNVVPDGYTSNKLCEMVTLKPKL